MKLVLIRHSKTQPTTKIPIRQWGLTEEGIQFAQSLSQSKVIKPIEVMYSSLQTKAIETALYLAKPNGIPMKTHPGLDEISSFTRSFLGDSFEVITRDYYQEKLQRIDEGETWREALRRFNQSLETIVAIESKLHNSNIGIVSHGNILSYFSSHYTQGDPLTYHKEIRMPDVAFFNWDTKEFETEWGRIKI